MWSLIVACGRLWLWPFVACGHMDKKIHPVLFSLDFLFLFHSLKRTKHLILQPSPNMNEINDLVTVFLTLLCESETTSGVDEKIVDKLKVFHAYYGSLCDNERFSGAIDHAIANGVYVVSDRKRCKHCGAIIDLASSKYVMVFLHYMKHHPSCFAESFLKWKTNLGLMHSETLQK